MFKSISLALYVLVSASLSSTELVAQKKLTTLFTSDNGGGANWMTFFDLKVVPANGVAITALEVNVFDALDLGFALEVYITPTTYVGNDGNGAAWSKLATGYATAAGNDFASTVTFDTPFRVPAGTWGIGLYYVGAQVNYTNGTGSNQTFSNAELTLTAGISRSAQFGGLQFTPRVWNGSIYYDTSANPPSFVSFGFGCSGTNGTPALAAAAGSSAKINTTFRLSLANLPTQAGPVLLMLGASRLSYYGLPLPLDLSPINMTGCRLYSSIDFTAPGTNFGGSGTISLPIPNAAFLIGGAVYCQTFVLNAGANPLGATLSNAGQFIVGQ